MSIQFLLRNNKMYIILTNDKHNQTIDFMALLRKTGNLSSNIYVIFFIMTHYLFKKVTIVMIIL